MTVIKVKMWYCDSPFVRDVLLCGDSNCTLTAAQQQWITTHTNSHVTCSLCRRCSIHADILNPGLVCFQNCAKILTKWCTTHVICAWSSRTKVYVLCILTSSAKAAFEELAAGIQPHREFQDLLVRLIKGSEIACLKWPYSSLESLLLWIGLMNRGLLGNQQLRVCRVSV